MTLKSIARTSAEPSHVRGEIARQITMTQADLLRIAGVSHNHLRSMVSARVDEKSELTISGGG
jgi:hypothetical protein